MNEKQYKTSLLNLASFDFTQFFAINVRFICGTHFDLIVKVIVKRIFKIKPITFFPWFSPAPSTLSACPPTIPRDYIKKETWRR